LKLTATVKKQHIKEIKAESYSCHGVDVIGKLAMMKGCEREKLVRSVMVMLYEETGLNSSGCAPKHDHKPAKQFAYGARWNGGANLAFMARCAHGFSFVLPVKPTQGDCLPESRSFFD